MKGWVYVDNDILTLYLNCLSAVARPEPEMIERVLPVPAESVGGMTLGRAWAVTIELTDELYNIEKKKKKHNRNRNKNIKI